MNKGSKVSLMAVGVNLSLFGAKYFFAVYSGSLALKAEAFHTLADVITSGLVFCGLFVSRLKFKAFPYGLYKVENLVSVLVAMVIFWAGYEIVFDVLTGDGVRLIHVKPTMICVLCIIGVTYAFSRYEAKVGKAINSPSLVADAQHIRVDMFANAAVLVGLLSNHTAVNLDRISALVIVLIIGWSGGKILFDGLRALLDGSVDKAILNQAREVIYAESKVAEIRRLTGRNSGAYLFIEAVILIRSCDWNEAHHVADRIESRLKQEINNIDCVTIHYEPMATERLIARKAFNEATTYLEGT